MAIAPATSAATAPTPSAPTDAAPSRAEALSRAYIDEELARMARYQAWADDMAERVWRRAVEAPAAGPAPLSPEAAPPTPPPEPLTDTAAAPPPSFGGDLSLAFHRVTRAACIAGTRRAAMIEALRRLECGEAPFARRAMAPTAVSGATAAGPGIDPRHPPLTADEARRVAVEASIKALAELEHPDDAQAASRLFDEAHERLHEDARFAGFVARPISATVGDLWAALGREPDWPAVADAAWASEAEAWRHTGALRVTVVHGARQTEPPGLAPSGGPPGRPPRRPPEPGGTPEAYVAAPDHATEPPHSQPAYAQPPYAQPPYAQPPHAPPPHPQPPPPFAFSPLVPRPVEPEPTWSPGEGPPPRPRRSRPYWQGPS